MAELAARGAWCFPLATPGGVLGLLVLGGPHTGRPSREVLSLAEDLAGRIALALENARLAAQQHAAGQALRAVLLPAELPRLPRVELAVAHDLPGAGAAAAGGDFCDVFPAGPGRWRFAVGEVCGTGPAILAMTSLARNTLRILAADGLGIPAVLDRLNQLILDERVPGTFLTLVHGEITGPGAGGPVRLSAGLRRAAAAAGAAGLRRRSGARGGAAAGARGDRRAQLLRAAGLPGPRRPAALRHGRGDPAAGR